MSTEKRLSLLSPLLSQIDEAMPHLHNSIDTEQNKFMCQAAFKAWVVSTTDNLYNYGYSSDSVMQRISTLVGSFLTYVEPSVVLLCSKCAYDTFINLISLKVPLSYLDFKDRITSITRDDKLTDAFLAPINRMLSHAIKTPAVFDRTWIGKGKKEIYVISQYFGFLTKLPLTNTELENQALVSYLDMEENYPIMDNSNPYLQPLKVIIEDWMRDYRYNGDECKHGKGAVADAKSYKLDKYKNMHLDTRLEYLYKRYSDLGIYDFLPLGASKDVLDRCSKLIFVPKNVSKLRTISMEPASLQYVQQGVMSSLYTYIADQRSIYKHIKLDDQFQNMSLAYDGSITNRYATIDLSAASDSVSYVLVKTLTRQLPELYRWIVGTRSDYTKIPDGTRVKLNKFAPMGSALCFPIETLIFAAIAKLATLIAHERGDTRDSATGIYNDFYSVYGDDIIIPRTAYDITVEILHSFNFTINEDKSYCDSPFKESCGGNYYCGLDITPIRWTIELMENGECDGKGYMALCSLCNNAESRNCRIFRSYLIKRMVERGYAPLFSNKKDVSPLIFSTHCTNFHLRRRYNKYLQKEEVRYDIVRPVRVNLDESTVDCNSILYFELQRRYDNPNYTPSMSNNMNYDSKKRILNMDVSQPLSSLSIMEKVTKRARGWSDYVL